MATTSGSLLPWLSTTRMSPCSNSCTGLVRCGPTCANPIARSRSSVSGESTPISTNANPSSSGRRRERRVLEQDQRAHGVDRRAARVGLAKDVVEHLERQRAAVAGGQHPRREAGDVECALAGEAAVVAAPLQDVHPQVGRIRELQEEDLLAGDRVDRVQRGAAAEDVEGVQARAERRVIGGGDDPPGVVVLAHVPAPGERLVRDLQAARVGALGELVQVRGGERVVVDRVRRDVRAHEHGRRAERLHHVELGLGATEVRLRHGLEVAERLIEVDRQAEVGGERAYIVGAQRRVDQVGLEQLDAVEARGRGRLQLLVERAAQADRGDRALHRAPTGSISSARCRSMRSRSGVTPVNSSSEPAACMTAIPPPSSVRHPSSRARLTSSVSSGR